MQTKKWILQVFESMWLAWLWLFGVTLHIFILGQISIENGLTRFIDACVFFSSFFLYSSSYTGVINPLLFFYQFIFWWFIGALLLWAYRR